MRLSHIYFQIFATFAVKLRINPYLTGSDYRLIVRKFADDDEAKEAAHERFCTQSETFCSGALKEPERRRRKY
jgi:hypothetical protein